ncbi:acetyl-CoA C-acyltransferase, partial [Dietzia sp. SLG510A3-40A3]|nr:acetyl-CoA C-acyltransferase [Dietzia sp. SLG510A3-40A3]
MRDVVICKPLRTPVGRFGGVFRDLDANTLATGLLTALVERTGLTGADVDDVVLGQGSPNGEGPAIGRIAALDSPLGIDVPGLQLDRRCGSGLQAIITGALQVASGGMDLVVAGGVESMSQVEFYTSPSPRWGIRGDGISLVDRLGRARTTVGGHSHIIDGGMIETAENLRREYGISRDEQDRLAVQSHQRAVAAQESGAFAEEIVPVTVPQRKGDDLVVDTDEHPRADSSVEALARLRPIMGRTDPEATVTAGNASGQNDGAAMCVVTTADRAAALGLTPLVRLASWAVAGVAPETMGIG